MELLGFAIKDVKSRFIMAEDGTFSVMAAQHGKLYKTAKEAYKVAFELRSKKDINAIVIEVVKEL